MARLKRISLSFLFTFAVISGLFFAVDRFCHPSFNNRFLEKITSLLPYNPEWELPPLSKEEQAKVETILSQPFSYLGKGCQVYAFISQDKQYVLKVFKQRSTQERSFLDRLPFSFNPFYKNKLHRMANFQDAMESSKTAFLELKDDAALLYGHLTKQEESPRLIALTDKQGRNFQVDINDTAFVLQKKADLLYPRITSFMKQGDTEGAKRTISSLLAFLEKLSRKGVVENDPSLRKNFGFVQGQPIQIDVGKLKIDPTKARSSTFKADLGNITQSFKTWLCENYPELNPFFEEALTATLSFPQIKIDVSSLISLADEEIQISLSGFKPYQKILLEAQTFDKEGEKWSSFAAFQADGHGMIKLKEHAPLHGSYNCKDSMGLFWSMRPESGVTKEFQARDDMIEIELRVPLQDQFICSQKIVRMKKAPYVTRHLIQENGIVGALFLPPSSTPLPLVITLSGSNGGLSESRAKLLASRGFATLALGYFAVEGLPPTLEKIPMEYFEKAFSWIASHPAIDSSRVAVYGVSRGGELSLLLGSLFPDKIKAIVATVPSSALYAGLRDYTSPAWVHKGKAIKPNAPFPLFAIKLTEGKDPSKPFVSTPYFLQGMQNKKAFEAASIEVEAIECPILLISGGDDQIWPSFLFAKQVEQNLKNKGSCSECQHLFYPKAGHQINIPFHPAADPVYFHPVVERWFAMGGTPQEDELASRDSWTKICTFLQKTLGF